MMETRGFNEIRGIILAGYMFNDKKIGERKKVACKIIAQMDCKSRNFTPKTDNAKEMPSEYMKSITVTNGRITIVNGGTNLNATIKIENATNSNIIIKNEVRLELMTGISCGKDVLLINPAFPVSEVKPIVVPRLYMPHKIKPNRRYRG